MNIQVGDRVRVDITEIPKNQRDCETGEVTKIWLKFAKTPEYRTKVIHVRFDKNYVKEKYRHAFGITEYGFEEKNVNRKDVKYPVFVEVIKDGA